MLLLVLLQTAEKNLLHSKIDLVEFGPFGPINEIKLIGDLNTT